MQYNWLNKQNNDKLIVFFAGWSFDENPFKCLKCGDYDIIMLYDYNNLEGLPDFENYKQKILITWSMGVFIAYLLKNKLPAFDKKIAINGTPYPIDDKYGIPKRTFYLTLKYAETGLRGKFYQNVFSDDEFLAKYLENPVERSIQKRVEELISLDKLIRNTNVKYKNFYDKAIVGLNDKIIPPKNQLAFWGDIAQTLDCGHFPFYNYKCWDEICN